MKYLLTIIIIVVSVTVITVFFFWPEQELAEEDVLVIVNDHKIPRALLEQKRSQGGHYSEDEQTLLDTIIVNELLLQEAQRRKINLEPSFRLSVQNYYEQSLIKILIDRQFNEMDVNVSDDEIDRYISNYTKIFSYTLLTKNKAKEADFKKSSPFVELSDFLKLTLNGLTTGERATVYSNSGEPISYRLDKIESSPELEPYRGSRESIKNIITNYKQERALTAWINKLRDQATIIIPDRTEKP